MQKHRQELELIKAHEIRSPAIYAYLVKERGLLRPLVNCYFKEVRYRHRKSGKQYFAIGMENQSGGYEIRAASDQYNFKKSCLGAKDITIIPGSSPGQSVNIFEGGIDCLSLMVMLNSDHLIGDSIILNSTSLFERAAEYIRQQSYKDIHTFLDNDQGGQECTEQFLQEFGERVNPQNDMYANYKDLNQALVDNLSSGFSTESV
jgi:5S rRNA maturation endonuclease (ribonuclease M5)